VSEEVDVFTFDADVSAQKEVEINDNIKMSVAMYLIFK
jgi:hypothetical protein